MKGSYGLIVAAVLGVLGVVLNWVYLQNKTRDVESISFLGLKEGVAKQPGEYFSLSDFEEVRIPERYAGNLKDYVHLYSDMKTVVGYSPVRVYQGGQLIIRDDLRTPARELAFTSPNQRLYSVKVDPTFEASLYNPGDVIDFIIPVLEPRSRVVEGASGQTAAPTSDFEVVGPFTIAHIGPRLGGSDTAEASRQSPGRVSSVGVFLNWEGDDYDALGRKLVALYRKANRQNLEIQMHSPLASSKGP